MTSTAEALQLLRAGRVAEAERAFQALLEVSPDNVEALNVTGLIAIRNGQGARAVEIMTRAAQIAPEDPMTQHHLGLAQEVVGDFSSSLAAHERAIKIAPQFHIGRLHLGRALERMDKRADAAVQYSRALQDAQASGRWLNADTTPPNIREYIEHAVFLVRTSRRETFDRLWSPIVQKYGAQSLSRVEKCMRLYLNEEAPQYSDTRQLPTFLYFPDLPTMPYFDRKLFAWIAELEGQTDHIRNELMALLPSEKGRERVFTSEELEQENLRGATQAPTWNGYYFFRHGERRAENCASCPQTTAAIDKLPLSRVRDHGPEILFSVFTAGTHLLPHRGVTNTRVVAHLPLIVPRDCALKVADEVHAWQEGRVVVFDDTYMHEAWNRSDSVRVVLIFDLWNPYLTEAECMALTSMIESIGDFRISVDAA